MYVGHSSIGDRLLAVCALLVDHLGLSAMVLP